MEEEVLLGNIPQEVRKVVDTNLVRYSVGLTGGKVNSLPNEMDIVGSGVLIQVEGLYVVLTADHVIGCLLGTETDCQEVGTVGLVMAFTEDGYDPDPLIIQMGELKKGRLFSIARDPQKLLGVGPDLGAIQLTEAEVAKIKLLGKSFYDLAKGRDKLLNDSYAREKGLRVIYGFPGATTTWEAIDENNTTFVPNFGHRGLWGGAEEEVNPSSQAIDYFSVEIGKAESTKLPRTPSGKTSLSGISGSGVWHVPVVKNGEYRPDLMIENAALRGLVFGNIRFSDEDRILSVSCHGWQSIYETAYTHLQEIAIQQQISS